MRITFLALIMILGSGCISSNKDKPSDIVQKSGKEILLHSSNIIDLAIANKKSVENIRQSPAPETIKTETANIDTNSNTQIKDAQALTDQGKVLKKESKEIKKTEDAADKGSIPNKLLAFSGIMSVLGVFCLVIFFLIKNKYLLLAGVGCFALSLAALVLRQYWTEIMIGATIAFVLGLIYFGRLIYISFKSTQTHKDVNAELVNLFEVIKKKYPDIKNEIFGDSTNPVGLAYHLLSDKADSVISEIRGKDVPPKAN